jgi:cell division protein ZipA
MDKELLRVVIIGTGLIIVMGLLAWSYFKNRKLQEDEDFDFQEVNKPSKRYASKEKKSESVSTETDDVGPVRTIQQDDDFYDSDDDIEPSPRISAPAIIQFSLLANTDEGFNGLDLVNAFGIVGLEYGSLKIYERLDAKRLVDFGVASMVGTGIFPDEEIESFFTPGLIFFMQPGVLDDAQAIFDDYIETLQLLAIELDGTIFDHHKHKLTDATIQALRLSL